MPVDETIAAIQEQQKAADDLRAFRRSLRKQKSNVVDEGDDANVRIESHAKHDQTTHGRKGGKKSARPSSMSRDEFLAQGGIGGFTKESSTFDGLRDKDGNLDFENHGDEIQAISKKRRKLDDEWEADTKDAVSMGDLDPNEAEKRGLGTPRSEDWVELPEDVYHVTTNAEAVRRDGLKSRDELGGTAALGGGETDTVSFTADRETALGIERGLREGVAVAKGDITVDELIDNAVTGSDADRPYIEDLYQGGTANISGSRDWKKGDPEPDGFQVLRAGRKLESDKMAYAEADLKPGEKLHGNTWQGGDGNTYAGGITRPATKTEKQTARFELYKRTSTYREEAGGPLNPLFFAQDTGHLASTKKENIKVMKFKPAKKGAKGVRLSALGEIRTYTGDAVELAEELPAAVYEGKKWREFLSGIRMLFHGKHDQKTHGRKKGAPAGQVSFEAQPSTSMNPVPGIQNATFSTKRGYMNDAVGAMGNPETGASDELAEASGLDANESFEVVGVWKGNFSPGMQVEIDKGASDDDVEAYAAGLGQSLKQDAVGYHRPFFDGNPRNDQGAEIDLGETISKKKMGDLYNEMGPTFGDDRDDIALVASKRGVRALNFSSAPPEEFQVKLSSATSKAFPNKDIEIGTFDFKGGLVENDWKENPNGEGYDSKIAKGPSALRGAVDRVNTRVSIVNQKWSNKIASEGSQAATG